MTAQPNLALAQIGRGFADPVHGGQRAFRCLLEAMARPGRIQTLPPTALQGMEPPGLGRALTAVLLTLLDGEVDAWLAPELASERVQTYVRFHTGARLVAQPSQASMVVGEATRMDPAIWRQVALGSDAAPQDGATLIIDVPALHAGAAGPGCALRLRGPGIAQEHTVSMCGLDAAFWRARDALRAEFPRGADLVLCCGDELVAVPRTTHVTWEA